MGTADDKRKPKASGKIAADKGGKGNAGTKRPTPKAPAGKRTAPQSAVSKVVASAQTASKPPASKADPSRGPVASGKPRVATTNRSGSTDSKRSAPSKSKLRAPGDATAPSKDATAANRGSASASPDEGRAAAAKKPSAPRKKPTAATRSASSDADAEHRKAESPAVSKAITAKRATLQKPRSGSEIRAARDARFDAALRSACLRAGTAAAISTLTTRVPLLGRLAPVVLGSLAEAVALTRVQQQLVREILDIYELELSRAEEEGVTLLATAANIGAQQLSRSTVEALVRQFGGSLARPVLSRVLPMATLVAEIAAAVASTYAVGKRAQALCKLPGTGARDLSELLRGLSGIDRKRLFAWSSEALRLSLAPFRGVLGLLRRP